MWCVRDREAWETLRGGIVEPFSADKRVHHACGRGKRVAGANHQQTTSRANVPAGHV